ncbi:MULTISPECIES: APC family permease [unclassified Bacillus (in: firmicutes)]|uniref:APC family permease n=1 Tax=unclassified Bacillus (in: firmicutes) TaxID=185979 RepID=UPI0008E95BB4|nr:MULTISPECIES: amino acid permease [unclassified Bacillus (in: firmicutes)]SFI25692.1 serine/threonine exchange transporter, LAT family [Bacillus sp. 71mf]SFS40906.1 serine/threonine exchange transporter, LAT family [Bacillus sp. 103mf]
MSQEQLKKEIGFFAALTTVIGTVIGAGVFFKPTALYGVTGSASLGLLAWVIGGILTVCSGLTAAELSAAIPETGGMMAYLKRTYGNLTAFLLGWAQTVIYFPANIAALAIIFGTQAVSLFGLNANEHKLMIIGVAVITAAFVTFMNSLGAKAAGGIQMVSTICKLVPLALLIIFGLLHKGDVTLQLFPVEAGPGKSFISALGSGLLATMFAYDGWIHVGNIAGEMKNPKKDLPKAIVIGLSTVMVVYLLINIAFLMVMSATALAGTDTPASQVATILFGAMGGKLVTIGILISVFGTINGYIMTGMRIPYAMALENKLPFSKWFATLSKNGHVPYNSGIFMLCVSIIMMVIGGFNTLTDMLVFVIWIFYTMTFVAVFILRKREPDLVRPYKVPLYPIIPIISILGGSFIVINTLFTQTLLALCGIGLTALGLPIYFAMRSKHVEPNK